MWDVCVVNGVYVVDVVDIFDVGFCKVESWLLYVLNVDIQVVVNFFCVVDFFWLIEFSLQIICVRSDGDWSMMIVLKVKMNFIFMGIG